MGKLDKIIVSLLTCLFFSKNLFYQLYSFFLNPVTVFIQMNSSLHFSKFLFKKSLYTASSILPHSCILTTKKGRTLFLNFTLLGAHSEVIFCADSTNFSGLIF